MNFAQLQDKLRRRPVARTFAGLKVMIENDVGDVRRGTDRNGHHWAVTMRRPYGYIARTKGADGEGIDVYLGPRPDAGEVYVIHQDDPDTRRYDEDKVMLGFESAQAAKSAYLMHYDRPGFFRSMTTIPAARFRSMLSMGKPDGVRWTRKHRRCHGENALFAAGGFDPAQHPRGGYPQNRGEFSPKELAAAPLTAFARHVQRLGDEHDTGLGENKVYLSHVHAKTGMPADAFKARMKDAAHAGLLHLSRADLPLNPDEEARSEIDLGHGGTVHYLQVEPRQRTQIADTTRTSPSAKPDGSRAGRVKQGIAAPHEHTLAEYRERQAAPHGYAKAPPAVRKTIDDAHRRRVAEALAGEEPVAPEVLADYPDLTGGFAAAGLLTFSQDDGWITVGSKPGPDGKRHGGSPVHIGKGGAIDKGPKVLKGKKLDETSPNHPLHDLRTGRALKADESEDLADTTPEVPGDGAPGMAGPRRRSGIVRPVDQEAQSARGLGRLTLDTDEAGNVDPNLVQAYQRHLATTGHQLGEFEVNPATKLATAKVWRPDSLRSEQDVARAIGRGEELPEDALAKHPHLESHYLLTQHENEVKQREQERRQQAAAAAAMQGMEGTPEAAPEAANESQPAPSLEQQPPAEPANAGQQPPVQPPAAPAGTAQGFDSAKMHEIVKGLRAQGMSMERAVLKAREQMGFPPPPPPPKPEPAAWRLPENRPPQPPEQPAEAEPEAPKPLDSTQRVLARMRAKEQANEPQNPPASSGAVGGAAVPAPAAVESGVPAGGKPVEQPGSAAQEGVPQVRQPDVAAPSQPFTETPDTRPTPAKRPRAATRKAGTQTKTALQQQILQAWRDQGGDNAAQDDKALADYHSPFTFHKQLPGEVKDFLQGRSHLKRLFNVSDDPEKAQGADALGKLGDEYWNLAERRGGGDLTAALDHARKSDDPQLRLIAAIHDTLPPASERHQAEPVPPSSLGLDTAGTINGIPVRVTENEEGERILQDGGDLPETPVDALAGPVPFDKGSVHKEEPELPDFAPPEEEPTTEAPTEQAAPDVDNTRQLGLYAKDAQGNPVEVGEHAGQANLFNPSKYKTAAPPPPAPDPIKPQFDPKHTAEMFPAKAASKQPSVYEKLLAGDRLPPGHVSVSTAVYRKLPGVQHGGYFAGVWKPRIVEYRGQHHALVDDTLRPILRPATPGDYGIESLKPADKPDPSVQSDLDRVHREAVERDMTFERRRELERKAAEPAPPAPTTPAPAAEAPPNPSPVEAPVRPEAHRPAAGKDSFAMLVARAQLRRAEQSGDPMKVKAAKAKIDALQAGKGIGGALSAASEAAAPNRPQTTPQSVPLPADAQNPAVEPDMSEERRAQSERKAAERRAAARMGEREPGRSVVTGERARQMPVPPYQLKPVEAGGKVVGYNLVNGKTGRVARTIQGGDEAAARAQLDAANRAVGIKTPAKPQQPKRSIPAPAPSPIEQAMPALREKRSDLIRAGMSPKEATARVMAEHNRAEYAQQERAWLDDPNANPPPNQKLIEVAEAFEREFPLAHPAGPAEAVRQRIEAEHGPVLGAGKFKGALKRMRESRQPPAPFSAALDAADAVLRFAAGMGAC